MNSGRAKSVATTLAMIGIATIRLTVLRMASRAFAPDDDSVAFGYSQNVAVGHGLTFCPDLPLVDGHTPFLRMLVMVIPREQ